MSGKNCIAWILAPDDLHGPVEAALKAHGLSDAVVLVGSAAQVPEGMVVYDSPAAPHLLGGDLDRLRALIEKQAQTPSSIGPYTLCPDKKALVHESGGSADIVLTEREYDLLKILAQAGESGVGRETLLQKVWGYNALVETHTLETHIYRLRQKIEEDPSSPAILLTMEDGYGIAGA